jgi:hypothetical protein
MSNRKRIIAIAIAAAMAATALPLTQASAAPIITSATAGGGAGAGWPVWALGGGVISLMLRAAYVYRTQCRELTQEEAFTGVGAAWPVFQQYQSKCAPVAASPVVGRY